MEPWGTPTLTGYSYEDFPIQNHPNLHITEKRRNKTPALTGYSWEDFPSRTTWSHLLLRKEEIRPNILPEIPLDLSLWKSPACEILY